jgi:predicted enzyme related to lactoylglutathione lyase
MDSGFLGLRTVVYQVSDLERAKAWYRSLLGIDPYFDQPFYVGFNVGGFELGLHPADESHRPGPGGAVPYWGVTRMSDAWERVQKLGAAAVESPHDVGEGIQVATIKDPFGNLIGLIENPHFPTQA